MRNLTFGALAAGLLALSAFSGSTPALAQQAQQDDVVQQQDRAEGEFDLGWLGLVGLAGLFGLMRRDRDREHHHTTTTRGATP